MTKYYFNTGITQNNAVKLSRATMGDFLLLQQAPFDCKDEYGALQVKNDVQVSLLKLGQNRYLG